MKKLSAILENIKYDLISGNLDTEVYGLELDSREIKSSFAFIAIKGNTSDGHQFIESAIRNGASVIFCECEPQILSEQVNYVKIENLDEKLSTLAGNYYEFPSDKLRIVGVTGTNGKTTIATLLYHLFNQAGYRSGLISTVAYYVGKNVIKSTHTTPNILKLNQLFSEMVHEACEFCFMEVSSHAIDQGRIAGINFEGGIFTNLTHDHLDYHKTFKNYLDVKKRFFDHLDSKSFALANIDDKNGTVMIQNTKARKYTFSCTKSADFRSRPIENQIDGTLIQIEGNEVWTQFTGKFNVSNLTAVYGASILCGLEKEKTLKLLSGLTPVRGRFETVKLNQITGIIDYAHTPDALENILKTINEIKSEGQSLITVVGAGGDRDKTKRPIMAKIAVENSEKLILTSDNPRTEIPNQIIEEMEKGIGPMYQKRMLKITDRREAIKTACLLANRGDIILIAGKGHETYQEINGVRYDFDDKQVFVELMKSLGNE
jgi:UDP-N-acetylmuramoyl-L-alanyl-D-glutamate--2,6-diaminopimelate ligase